MTMNERLRARADQLDIKQNELAKKIGVSPTTLNGYFTGYRVPDAQTLITLANHLDMSIDYLLTGEEQKNSPPDETGGLKDEVMAILENLPEEHRAEVMEYGQYLLEKYKTPPK